MAIGTVKLADTLAVADSTLVINIGMDNAFGAVNALLETHNAQVEGMLGTFVERTTDEARRNGGPDTMTMEALDETGVPRPQKVSAGATVGFPLMRRGIGQQWTHLAMKKLTVRELDAATNAAMTADKRDIRDSVRRAIFTPTNTTYFDALARKIDIPVKALANADSMPLPVGPNGETFDASTHTHYLARVGGSLVASDLDSLIVHVREHSDSGDLAIVINAAQETTVRGFSGFVPAVDPRIVQPSTATFLAGQGLSYNYNDRVIGMYNGATIMVKPWSIANYIVAHNTEMVPLCYRYDADYGDGLKLFFEGEQTIFNARGFERIYGVGVWQRHAAAVLYTGGTTYVAPTI